MFETSRIMRHWISLVMSWAVVLRIINGGELETIFTRCCNLGATWAGQQRSCDLYPAPISGVDGEHQTTCLATVGICCLRHYRILMCDIGKDDAIQNKLCWKAGGQPGGEFRKDCCDGCKLGLMAGTTGGSCSMNSFGFDYPWDEAFADCCQLGKLSAKEGIAAHHLGGIVNFNLQSNQVAEENRCEQINPCQHNCHDNGGVSVECSCHPGYQLADDQRACVDVDECSLGLHTCDRNNQQCTNTDGGFLCLNENGSFEASSARQEYGSLQASRTTFSPVQPPERSADEVTNPSEGRRCPQGYEFNVATKTCNDVDECAEGQDFCNRNREFCLNTIGGYECQPKSHSQCPAGYKYNDQTRSCEDIDECAEHTDNCDPETQICMNTRGSFQCTLKPSDCPPGYRYDTTHNNCLDINECISGTHTCDDSQLCINMPGSYQCQTISPPSHQCSAGFRYSTQSKSCVDVNECQLGNHNCATSQRCDNTIGSFTCIRTTGCGTGYTLNAQSGQCEDDNECLLGTHNCGGVYVCRNTLGSFRCDRKVCPQKHKLNSSTGRCFLPACNPGFEPNTDGDCTDINECTLPNACGRNQLCLNTVGSFQCESQILCNDGYELNAEGAKCVDIDECAQGKHDCKGTQNCINRPGGYACQCPLGYTINSRRECEDIDECERYGQICTDQGECRNTPGSYVCHCKSGFTQTDDGKTCIDQDECQQKYICQQRCINSWGSYQCTCDQGYNLAEDKRTCTDVDECSEWEGRGNLCLGICVNDPGSYSCRCPDGYKLAVDKRTCQDIDECSQGTVCTGTNEVCLNTRGGFRCNTVVCPHNYVRDTEHRNRCKRVSLVCQQGDPECLRAPLSFSYNYITFVSNLRIPASGQIDLFTMRGPLWTSTTVHFSLELVSARAPNGVKPASRDYFRLRRTSIPNQAVVSLLQSIPGPQDIEIELIMKLYSSGSYHGQAVAKIFIYVSQYEF